MHLQIFFRCHAVRKLLVSKGCRVCNCSFGKGGDATASAIFVIFQRLGSYEASVYDQAGKNMGPAEMSGTGRPREDTLVEQEGKERVRVVKESLLRILGAVISVLTKRSRQYTRIHRPFLIAICEKPARKRNASLPSLTQRAASLCITSQAIGPPPYTAMRPAHCPPKTHGVPGLALPLLALPSGALSPNSAKFPIALPSCANLM